MKSPKNTIFGIDPDPRYTLHNEDVAPPYSLPITGTEEILQDEQYTPPSFTTVFIIISIAALLLGGRCFQLQLTRGASYQARAEGNSVRVVTIPAERGLITDVKGKVLVQNNRHIALAINPQTLPSKSLEREKIYNLLRTKAGIDEKTITFIEENRLESPEIFPIKSDLSKDESLLFQEWFQNIPGIVLQEAPIRTYTSLPSLGQIAGYISIIGPEERKAGYALNQLVGKTGVEKTYEKELSGRPGKEKAEVDAEGEVVRTFSSTNDSTSQPGKTLRLSIDSELQQVVANALTHELERRTKQYGPLPKLGASAVVMNPNNGEILAMVSLPDYDSNMFSGGISKKDYNSLISNPANPLVNRTIQGTYAPGSIIKPLIAGAALQEGVIKENTSMVTPEAIYIGGFRFPDWKTHGLTNTRKAIAESNDIFFYAVGGGWEERKFKGLGIDRMNAYLQKFGLGEKTGVDIPGEAKGLLPSPDWKKTTKKENWYIGDTYNSSIGQGFTLVTPLQMTTATAAIVNGGTVWQPKIGHSLIDPTTNKETLIDPVLRANNIISTFNAKVVREGMRETVLTGSARPLNKLKVASAGKTGTAQYGTEDRTHAWYTGFAPFDNPEMVFTIMIEGGGDSFYSSVPVAEEILRGYFHEPLAENEKLLSAPNLSDTEFQGEH